MTPSERYIQSEQWGLDGIPYSAMGWQLTECLTAWVSWLPRLEALHTICFSHQRDRARPQPLIYFSHDLHLWVLLGVFLVDTKRFCTVVFLAWLNAISQTTGNAKHLPVPLGIPHAFGNDGELQLVWKIMSHVVCLASSVKTVSRALPKQQKWSGSHLCFGNFLWADWDWEKGMWVKVQIVIKAPVVALQLYSPLHQPSPRPSRFISKIFT